MLANRPGARRIAPAKWSRMRAAVRRILGFGLVALSGIYIYRVVESSLQQLLILDFGISVGGWVVLIFGVLGTLVLATFYHIVATRRIELASVPASRIGLAYALGQIVRYIPGKIVGLFYQVTFLAGQLRTSTIALALIVQTAYDYVWTFAFAGAILLGATWQSPWPVAGLVPVCLGLWWSHARGWCERGLVFPAAVRRWLPEMRFDQLDSPPHSGYATLLLVLVWIPMLLGIAFALQGILGLADSLVLGAAYLLAAVGSLLVFVVPSGLVVREALFVWLGSHFGFDPAMLLFVGLVLRAAMTLAEVLNVVVFVTADAALGQRASGRDSSR